MPEVLSIVATGVAIIALGLAARANHRVDEAMNRLYALRFNYRCLESRLQSVAGAVDYIKEAR